MDSAYLSVFLYHDSGCRDYHQYRIYDLLLLYYTEDRQSGADEDDESDGVLH